MNRQEKLFLIVFCYRRQCLNEILMFLVNFLKESTKQIFFGAIFLLIFVIYLFINAMLNVKSQFLIKL